MRAAKVLGNIVLCEDLSIVSMVTIGNILVLKRPNQRTNQRVKRTSADRVRVSFGRSRARSFGRFAISLARSLDVPVLQVLYVL